MKEAEETEEAKETEDTSCRHIQSNLRIPRHRRFLRIPLNKSNGGNALRTPLEFLCLDGTSERLRFSSSCFMGDQLSPDQGPGMRSPTCRIRSISVLAQRLFGQT